MCFLSDRNTVYGGKAMATIGDVAKRAGVSTTLVSRYLNQVKGVSPASKEKIESAIRELNYVPDESARMLVRRRGGGTPSEAAAVQPTLPPAIALICKNVDFQLVSALYLGAKQAVWNNNGGHDYQILLFCITEKEDPMQAAEEAEILAYISKTCRGALCINTDITFSDKVTEMAIPCTSAASESNARILRRTSAEFKTECQGLEARTKELVGMLCERIAQMTVDAQRILLPMAFTVSDELQNEEHSPLGRSLQSHLL